MLRMKAAIALVVLCACGQAETTCMRLNWRPGNVDLGRHVDGTKSYVKGIGVVEWAPPRIHTYHESDDCRGPGYIETPEEIGTADAVPIGQQLWRVERSIFTIAPKSWRGWECVSIGSPPSVTTIGRLIKTDESGVPLSFWDLRVVEGACE